MGDFFQGGHSTRGRTAAINPSIPNYFLDISTFRHDERYNAPVMRRPLTLPLPLLATGSFVPARL
jgi:hypothetical protein